MKILVILIAWFIVSIPVGILFGKLFAAGAGQSANSSSYSEEDSDLLPKNLTQVEHSVEEVV